MIGMLRLGKRYRFVTNNQQLAKLADVIDNEHEKIAHTIILIDAELQAKPTASTTILIGYLMQVNRPLDIDIIFVGNQETRIGKHVGLSVNAEFSLKEK